MMLNRLFKRDRKYLLSFLYKNKDGELVNGNINLTHKGRIYQSQIEEIVTDVSKIVKAEGVVITNIIRLPL